MEIHPQALIFKTTILTAKEAEKMAALAHDVGEKCFTFIQTHAVDGSRLEELAEAINSGRITKAVLGDHPNDVGETQSPRKVLKIDYR